MTNHVRRKQDDIFRILEFEVHYPVESRLGPSTHIGLREAVQVRDSWNQHVNPEWPKAVIGLLVGNNDVLLTFEPLVQYIVSLENMARDLDKEVVRIDMIVQDALRKLEEVNGPLT